MNESQLVKTIRAHIAKGDKSAEKAQQHYIAAGQYLKTLKAQHGGTWAEWEALLKDKIGIGKSRASELMQIADGRKTVEDVRADTNKRKLEHRASVPERRGRTVEPGCPECGYTLVYREPCSEGGEHWACGQCGYVLCKKVCDCDGPLVLREPESSADDLLLVKVKEHFHLANAAMRDMGQWLLDHPQYSASTVAEWLQRSETEIEDVRKWAENGFEGPSPLLLS